MASNEMSAVKGVKKGGSLGLVALNPHHQVFRLQTLDAHLDALNLSFSHLCLTPACFSNVSLEAGAVLGSNTVAVSPRDLAAAAYDLQKREREKQKVTNLP